MLTGVEDVDRQILVRLDIPTLIIFNEVTDKVALLASDAPFWEMKFEYDHLPFLTTDFNKSFLEWIDEYVLIENIVNDADEILKIHAIEAVRRFDLLNLIMFSLVSDNIAYLLFDKPSVDNFNTQEYNINNILIELQEENNSDEKYKVILEGIVVDTDYRDVIIGHCPWQIVFEMLIQSMYMKPGIEILDQFSLLFLEDFDRNLGLFDENEKTIINKRFGIRDCLYHSNLLWR